MPPARKPARRDPAKKPRAMRPPTRSVPAKPQRAADVQLIPLDDGYLALRPRADRVHRLNASAALALELASGARTIAAIAAGVAEAYGLRQPPVAEIRAVFDQMAALGLVTSQRGAGRR